MKYLKSVGAVLAGLVIIFVLSMATDFGLERAGIIPKDNLYVAEWLILAIICYRILYSVLGCYIAARLAPSHPMRHALALGVFGVVFSTMGAIVNTQQNLGPDWYPWTLVVLALPAAWLGGWLYERKPALVRAKAEAKSNIGELTMTRVLDATRQKVWLMWTSPEHFAEWFGVPPLTATRESTSMDVRVGGAWKSDMVNANDGTRIHFGGTYLEIDPQKKLVFTMIDMQNPSNKDVETVTVTFKDLAGQTEMTMHQTGHLPKEQYGEPLQKGYSTFFERMIKHLAVLR